ncbi:unnamed protein product [Gongylonema pulchrum]|uniref:UBAP2 n=1 Tax=Gongylonema pulchrum TaxID=637853 RepID=A0A183D4B8_9BILA|nr:unnamed protein product [Gongylonema pulchrum]
MSHLMSTSPRLPVQAEKDGAVLSEPSTSDQPVDGTKSPVLSSSARARGGQGKPVVSLNNSNTKPMGLSLNVNDGLKTPTALGNTDVTLKTPTVLGSPTKGPLSAGAHVDELTTPKLHLNTYSTPTTQTQAFFGEHEPLLTGIILQHSGG